MARLARTAIIVSLSASVIFAIQFLSSRRQPADHLSSALEAGSRTTETKTVLHVAGRARSTSRRYIDDALVCARCISCLRGVPVCTRTRDGGAFKITGLLPQSYVLTAQAKGYVTTRTKKGSIRGVDLRNRRSVDGYDLLLDPGGAELRGRVIDRTGGAVPGAIMSVGFAVSAPN